VKVRISKAIFERIFEEIGYQMLADLSGNALSPDSEFAAQRKLAALESRLHGKSHFHEALCVLWASG